MIFIGRILKVILEITSYDMKTRAYLLTRLSDNLSFSRTSFRITAIDTDSTY